MVLYIAVTLGALFQMSGLCGNFDDNPGNDFRGPDGLLESTAVQFAEHFKLQRYCPKTQPSVVREQGAVIVSTVITALSR